MGGWGIWELVIVLVIVVLLFGTGKITGLGKSIGTAIHEFKDSVNPDKKVEEPVINEEKVEE
jgi:sec-independent protein translocase protein TatA